MCIRDSIRAARRGGRLAAGRKLCRVIFSRKVEDESRGCTQRRSQALGAPRRIVFSGSESNRLRRWPPLLPRASFFPKACRPQLLEEFAFGLLHTLGGFGIADRRGDAL